MSQIPLPSQMGMMITGYWVSQSIYTAAKYGIADLLADGPKPVDELASATGTKPDLLYRLLRALASVGVFAESTDRKFESTPLSDLLRSDVPGSQRPLALMMGDEHYYAWGKLDEAIRTGENAYETVFGKPVFDHMADHPEKAKIFDAAMTAIHGRETGAMIDSYDFTGINVIADIGGGNGTTISAVLERYPNMRGILFDLEHVVERAKPQMAATGLANRCDFASGDFFAAVPAGADAYLMRHIIHDWDDEKSLTILKNCHKVMSPGNKLLLIENVIPPGNGPGMAKFLDLTMMLIPGGKERTEPEYRALYDAAGFDLTRIVPTSADVSIIEGIRR